MKATKLSLVALMTALMVIVTACSGNNGGNTPPSPGNSAGPGESAATQKPEPPKERTKVEVLSWWDFTQSEPLKQLKAKFEELNPDLEMEYIQIGSGYADKVLTMIAGGGEMPEVMMLAMDRIPVYAEKGAILSLESYVSDEYLSSAYPVVSNALSFEGKPFAVARDITSKVMFLNKKMFDDAGVAYPKEDWTWEDFRAISKQLSGDSQWGFYFPKYADGYTSWLMQNNGGLVTQDGQSMLGKPESVDALQFLHDLVHVDKSAPTESQAQQFGSNDVSTFVAGKVAMIAGGLSYTATFEKEGVEYLIRPLPQGKQKLSTSFVNAWVIPKGADNPDLSWRVLEFLSGKEAQQIALDTGMGLPAVQGVDMKSFLEKHPDNRYLIEALSYSVPFPTPVHGAAFNTEVAKQFDLMWLGQKSVQEAVDAVEKNAASVLSGGK
jgi:multiple sugar transport system substrate-binding protein